MKLTSSILEDTKTAIGLSGPSFDTEILQHINSAISKLNQNGVGKFLVVHDDTSTWQDLRDENQIQGNLYFASVPLFITLSTKLLFDPPPPSNVQYHQTNVNETLWRLKVAYE